MIVIFSTEADKIKVLDSTNRRDRNPIRRLHHATELLAVKPAQAYLPEFFSATRSATESKKGDTALHFFAVSYPNWIRFGFRHVNPMTADIPLCDVPS